MDSSEPGENMQFLRLNLIDKHGVSDHRGEVLVIPSRLESVRSFLHADHLRSFREVGSVVTMKTGEKHWVSQRPGEIADMLRLVDEPLEEWTVPARTGPARIYRGLGAESV